jgi:hypothetical protein
LSQEYIPGSCNIGKGEIRRRQVVALAGAVISATSLVGLMSTDASGSARLSLFAPLIFSVGFIQSRKKFCMAYGFLGTFNFGKLGQISRVSDPIAKKADRKTALTILAQSIALALGLTLATLALPR